MRRVLMTILLGVAICLTAPLMADEAAGEEAKLDSERVWVLTEMPEETEVIAWRELEDGSVLIFQKSEEDIRSYIEYLKESEMEDRVAAGSWDDEMLTVDYWMNSSCTKRKGKCQGSCSKGSCQECCVRSCYCCCR